MTKNHPDQEHHNQEQHDQEQHDQEHLGTKFIAALKICQKETGEFELEGLIGKLEKEFS